MYIKHIFKHKIFTLPNILSLSRIIAAPLVWYIFVYITGETEQVKWLLIIIGFVILSDFFDGYLARTLKQETPLGTYLDPLADKVIMISIFILLYIYRDLPIWVVIIAIIREVLFIWGGIFLLIHKNMIARPNIWGKWGVVWSAVVTILYIVDYEYRLYSLFPFLGVFFIGIAVYINTYINYLREQS